jgi:hypothetical protein
MDNNSRRDFLKKSSLLALATSLPASHLMAKDEPVQSSATTTGSTPYKTTYARNVFVTDNEFRNSDPNLQDNPGFEKAREILPVPFWSGNQDAIDMYWKGWEIAFRNIKNPTERNGFIASYLDTAYNGNIFMWDSTFITMFARYGTRAFPFQKTLDNFYAKQHPDGFICREIWGESGEDAFHRYDPVSTGPNIIPWSEMEYFEHFEDWERIHKIFPVLSGYYQWLKLNRTWQDGSYWSSGWGTGMDNQPRLKREYNPLFSHGHMTWLDTNLQQLFIGKILVDFGFYVERWQEIEDIEDDTKFLTKYIKEKLWNPDTSFFYDRYADGSIGDFQSIGAFWALHTDLLNKNEMDSFVAHLKNPETFFRHHPIPSMPANHERYQAEGRYWQGGVWAPTNFMILSGLKNKGYNDLAFELATLHHQRVSEVFKKTGTFFEYYAPEASEPGLLARPDFVGWTGLVPIAVLFEIIFGIKPNALKRTMTWDVNLTEEHGIEKYPYGSNGTLSLKCHARRDKREKPKIEITSDASFRLTVNWAGETASYEVEPGMNSF